MHSTSTLFLHAYSGSVESSDENFLLPDSLTSFPLKISPEMSFCSSSESSSPSLYDGDHAQLNRRKDSDTTASLRGSYDSFFREGYHMRHFERGLDHDLSTDHTPVDDFSSSSDSDSEYDGDDDEEDIRSAIPAICATAVKVKITPLRAVRRTVRRSYLLDAGPRKSSAEDGIFNPYWGIFMNARDAPPSEDAHDAIAAGDTPRGPVTPPACAWGSLTKKLPMDNLKCIISAKKNESTPIDVDCSPPSGRSRSFNLSMSKYDSDMEGDIDIMEFHDVTQEAARLAAMMSFKWEFKPASLDISVSPRSTEPFVRV